MALQVGADVARVEGVGVDAVAAELVGEAGGEEQVGLLGATVRLPGAVGAGVCTRARVLVRARARACSCVRVSACVCARLRFRDCASACVRVCARTCARVRACAGARVLASTGKAGDK